jgi:hypothetical protein
VVADHKVVHADASGGDGAKADAKADDRAEADHRATADHDETAGHGATAHAGHEDAATHADADHDASDTGGDEVSAVLPAQDSAADATTGGGGAAAKPQKAAPSLGATKPESGLGQLRGVRPDRIGLLFGQMHTAAALTKASADITAERAKETQAESQARTADDAQIHELKADADQVGAGRLPMAHEVARTIPQTDSAGDTRFDMSQPRNPAEREADADRFANAGLALSPHDLWSELGILHTTRGTAAVQAAVQALGPDPRIRFGALLGVDLSFVRFERGAAADQLLDEIDADGAAIGATVYLRASLGAERAWELEAHELTHVAQTGGGTSELGNDLEVAPPESAVEQEAEAVGQQLAAFQPLARPLAQSAPAGTVLRGKGKIIGWLVKVGERKLVKTVAIYSEKELAKLLGKGFNVLVRDGRQVAKRIAKKVWGDETLHHTGHIIRKTGKLGLSHFQPLRHGVGRAGEKGWHIFYSALPILFFSEDVDAMVIYEDKYPGKSVANYLTVTQYAGKDSWLSYLDWVNPLELIAIGGDLGRDWDRERTKELKALIFTRQGPNGTIQTYELDPEGQLVKVYVQGPSGVKKEFTAQEYHELLG